MIFGPLTFEMDHKVDEKFLLFFVPWSLSLRSEQSLSIGMSQPGPNHPDSHQHSHSRAWLVLHCPWPLHPLGQPSKVQCLPFQPAKTNLIGNGKEIHQLLSSGSKSCNHCTLTTSLLLHNYQVIAENIFLRKKCFGKKKYKGSESKKRFSKST